MPFFKDAWRNITRPDQPNQFAQQYAAALLGGGDAVGPIERFGNKLIGGLLMGGQRGATKRQQEKWGEEIEEFMGLLAPGVEVARTTPTEQLGTGADPFTPMSVPTTQAAGGILAGGKNPFTPMSKPELTPEAVGARVQQKMPDVWNAMKLASKSTNPMLKEAAANFVHQQLAAAGASLDPKDRFAVTPQGVVFDRLALARTGDFDAAVKFNPIKEQKYKDVLELEDGTVLGIPMTGGDPEILWKYDPEKDIDTEIVWTDDPKDPSGYKQTGRLINSDTGDVIKHLGTRLQPGAGQGGWSLTQGAKTEIQKEAYSNEFIAENLQSMMDEFQTDPDLQEYFTLGGKIEFTYSKVKDYLGKLDKGSPERAKFQKIARFVARVERNSARMIKAMTGAQMSEAEAQRLLKGIANSTDTSAQFAGKLQAAIEEFQALGARYERWKKEFSEDVANMKVVDAGEDIIFRYENDATPAVSFE